MVACLYKLRHFYLWHRGRLDTMVDGNHVRYESEAKIIFYCFNCTPPLVLSPLSFLALVSPCFFPVWSGPVRSDPIRSDPSDPAPSIPELESRYEDRREGMASCGAFLPYGSFIAKYGLRHRVDWASVRFSIFVRMDRAQDLVCLSGVRYSGEGAYCSLFKEWRRCRCERSEKGDRGGGAYIAWGGGKNIQWSGVGEACQSRGVPTLWYFV